MRQSAKLALTTFFRLAVLGALFVPSPAHSVTVDQAKQTLGVYHWGGFQVDSSLPALVDGAKQARLLGSDIIALAMTPAYAIDAPSNSGGQADYAGTASDWGPGIHDLTSLAKSAPYQQVFNMPFKVYLLTAYTFGNHNFNGGNNASETQEIAELVTYLMTTYAGTGKTFIIKNWEGDNAMTLIDYGAYAYTPDAASYHAPQATTVSMMISWLNARHQGLVQGRANAGAVTGVEVHDAVEFNLVDPAKWGQGQRSMLTHVIPSVQADYVDYSAYDTTNLPPTSLLASSISADMGVIAGYVNARPVLIGELGIPSTLADANQRLKVAAEAFLNYGSKYVLAWAVQDRNGYALVNSNRSLTATGQAWQDFLGGPADPTTALAITNVRFTNQNGNVTMPAPADSTYLNVAWSTNLPAVCKYAGIGPQNGSGTTAHYATLSPVYAGYSVNGSIDCAQTTDATNTASVAAPVSVLGIPAITLQKSADVTHAASHDTITYTFHYQNSGSGPASNVVIADPIPPGTTYVPNSVSDGGSFSAGQVRWTLPSVAQGASGSMSFKVTVN